MTSTFGWGFGHADAATEVLEQAAARRAACDHCGGTGIAGHPRLPVPCSKCNTVMSTGHDADQ